MPDGDKVHERLAGRYQSPYKKLCEPHIPAETVAAEVCKKVLKDVKKNGDVAIDTLRHIAEILKDVQRGPLLQDLNDWCALRDAIGQAIRQRSREMQCDRRIIGIIDRTAQRVIEGLRQDADAENSSTALIRQYLEEIYFAEFEGRAPQAEEHYNGVSEEFVLERLDDIRPDINAYMDDLAIKIDEKPDVKSVKMPRRHSERVEPTVDDEIPLVDSQEDSDGSL